MTSKFLRHLRLLSRKLWAGYVTDDNYAACFGDAVDNIASWLEGRPIRALNRAP